MISTDDEIALIARHQERKHGPGAMQSVEDQIQIALSGNDWDALTKWHRVRFRMIRNRRG